MSAITKYKHPTIHGLKGELEAGTIRILRRLNLDWPTAVDALERIAATLDPADRFQAIERALKCYAANSGIRDDATRLRLVLEAPAGAAFLETPEARQLLPSSVLEVLASTGNLESRRH